MTGRYAIYEALDSETRRRGFAGFVETPKHLSCIGFRYSAEQVRAEIENAMRRRQIRPGPKRRRRGDRPMSERHEYWVCVDCYFAHHGLDHDDTPPDRDPLSEIPEAAEVFDWTDSETEEGVDGFSWRACHGCGSTLGGSRFRLAVDIEHEEEPA